MKSIIPVILSIAIPFLIISMAIKNGTDPVYAGTGTATILIGVVSHFKNEEKRSLNYRCDDLERKLKYYEEKCSTWEQEEHRIRRKCQEYHESMMGLQKTGLMNDVWHVLEENFEDKEAHDLYGKIRTYIDMTYEERYGDLDEDECS